MSTKFEHENFSLYVNRYCGPIGQEIQGKRKTYNTISRTRFEIGTSGATIDLSINEAIALYRLLADALGDFREGLEGMPGVGTFDT